jgi:hypothetical protein
MPKRFVIIGLALILCIFVLSCQRLNPQPAGLDRVDLKAIPASYGNLISVTTIPTYPDWVQMWFQDNTGTIRIIRVSFTENQMLSDIRIITRN